MPKSLYECLIMLDTSKVGSDLPAAVEQLHAVMNKNHAEIMASRPWDERPRLAYPIKGQKKALYYLLYFQTDGKNLVGIEHDFKLNETILRYLTLKIETKLEETMLALARDPHAVALQAVVNDPTDDFSDYGGGGGRDRRGPPRDSRPSDSGGKE